MEDKTMKEKLSLVNLSEKDLKELKAGMASACRLNDGDMSAASPGLCYCASCPISMPCGTGYCYAASGGSAL